ncbi:hypothetical protein XAP412_370100 [Xanthomonas phaseoli pv. phaseoli]|uniref:Uncharacterized protein n=1 Tax=Xanthomonas campestris pv. phaseoli TaxID=317013 RepID=A0AB38E1F0_XANCH|nr:hypothetical protein XAP6984_420151 [Xanthomonas phaseoli pv. phaseoli]SON84699.1 hypothetical protein XAP412_370100 [Xanthomonas phaseoli pv. phaseoli]SON89104.1 hypothetical protein XAP7430_400168 [Xanthomonas phaseoli pv. phaseoli]
MQEAAVGLAPNPGVGFGRIGAASTTLRLCWQRIQGGGVMLLSDVAARLFPRLRRVVETRPTTACDMLWAAVDSTDARRMASAVRVYGIAAAARLRMHPCDAVDNKRLPMRTLSFERNAVSRRCRTPTIARSLAPCSGGDICK